MQRIFSQLETDTSLSKAILDAMGDGVCILDPNYTIVYQNTAHLKMMGDHCGELCYKAYGEGDGLCEQCPVQESFLDGKIHHMEKMGNRERAGRRVEITASVFAEPGGEIIAGIEIVRDVTDRKIAEENLNQARSRFDMFMNSVPGIAFIKDLQGNLVYANHFIKTIDGASSIHASENSSDEFQLREVARELARCDHADSIGDTQNRTIRKINIAGEWKYWLITKFPLTGRSGEVEYLGGVGFDVSEIKNAENTLRSTTNELRSLAAHLQSIREEERIRIAAEIHDELGQQLTSVLLSLNGASGEIASRDSGPNSGLNDRIQEASRVVEASIQTVRRIATDLRPIVLDRFGLIAAIEWLAKEFSRTKGIMCEFTPPSGQPRLSREQDTALFRIIQESLTNIARHAHATRVTITINVKEDLLVLQIVDNGLGICEEALKGKNALGVLGMKERACVLGGTFAIRGGMERGTEVRVTIPLNDGIAEKK